MLVEGKFSAFEQAERQDGFACVRCCDAQALLPSGDDGARIEDTCSAGDIVITALPDDLDMILGTARLDTVYLAVTDQFNLFDHYKMGEKGEAARDKAAILLKKNTRVMKSEYGELKVKVWDTDKNLAPQLADAIMDKLQDMHTDLKSAGNEKALKGLQDGQKKIKNRVAAINDSIMSAKQDDESLRELAERKKILQDQSLQYDKLISEYQLMVDSKPPALLIVENAKVSAYPDKPKRIQILVATAILSFLFSLLAILVLERRKISWQ